MSAPSSGLRSSQLGFIAVALLTCVSFMGVIAGTSRADSSDWFCPTGGTSTISLAANAGCTNSLTEVAYYHASGANVDHCAVSKATSDPGGGSSNVLPAVCGYGASPYGELNTAYHTGGAWSYARGKNNEGVTHYDFYGFRWWL